MSDEQQELQPPGDEDAGPEPGVEDEGPGQEEAQQEPGEADDGEHNDQDGPTQPTEGPDGAESDELSQGESEPEPGHAPEDEDLRADSPMDSHGMAQDRLVSAGSSKPSSQDTSRPPSAVVNLRGSRPNSAAIAQEIEGFEDDFMERVDEEEEEEQQQQQQQHMSAQAQQAFEEGDEEAEEDLGPSVEELLERAQMEQTRLLESNELLQKKARLALDFRNKGRPTLNRDVTRLDGVNVRYKSSLKQWVETLEERDRVEGHYQSMVFDMKSSLEERIKRADDIARAYKHFRLEVARSAEHSKTARPISDRLITRMEHEDQEKEEEVQRVRLKNIHLTNQLRRIEATLRQKEELAEGLHLIDFEQLKIENQSLNEKIEERNEELLKLRKKTTTTVQILTHIREKLQFVEKENVNLTRQLDELDRTLSERRDRLGKAKAVRDTLRQKGRRIKETSVFITNPVLLDDIEATKEKREQLMFTIEGLKQEHAVLSEVITKSNTKIITMTEDLAAAGTPNATGILRHIQSSKGGSFIAAPSAARSDSPSAQQG